MYFNVDMKNVRQRQTTLLFSTSTFTTLKNVETTLQKLSFPERTTKKIIQIQYTEFKVLTTIS